MRGLNGASSKINRSSLPLSLCLLLFHGAAGRTPDWAWMGRSLGVDEEVQGTIANYVFHCIEHGAKVDCLNQEEPRQRTARLMAG